MKELFNCGEKKRYQLSVVEIENDDWIRIRCPKTLAEMAL
jgi:hypothetical protein